MKKCFLPFNQCGVEWRLGLGVPTDLKSRFVTFFKILVGCNTEGFVVFTTLMSASPVLCLEWICEFHVIFFFGIWLWKNTLRYISNYITSELWHLKIFVYHRAASFTIISSLKVEVRKWIRLSFLFHLYQTAELSYKTRKKDEFSVSLISNSWTQLQTRCTINSR